MPLHQPYNSDTNYKFNFRYYDETNYHKHFHKNLELIYVEKGTMTVEVENSSELLEQGDYALVLSNLVHTFTVYKNSRCHISVFSEDFVPKFASAVKNKQAKSFKFRPDDKTSDFIQECLIYKRTQVLMLKACLYAACGTYITQVKLFDKKAATTNLELVFNYINEHFNENIKLKDLANKFNYDYRYLSKILTKRYEINFNHLLATYRCEAAIEMLEHSDTSVTNIAYECGFQCIRSFNNVFKNIVGCTPTEYRKKMKLNKSEEHIDELTVLV